MLVIVLPAAAAAIWGTFRVPGDPGSAPVGVSGTARLALEACFFSIAALALVLSDRPHWAVVFGAIVLLHYLVSFDRIKRLIRQ